MAIPQSGQLKASQVNTEIQNQAGDRFSINSVKSRELAGRQKVGSRIAFSDYRGHQFSKTLTISASSSSTYDLRAQALAAGWDENSRIEATIKKGVTLRGNPALLIAGDFPKGVYLTIEAGARILGNGGKGGDGVTSKHTVVQTEAQAGEAGSPAIRLGSDSGQPAFVCYIYNYGFVSGGGGGGGGGNAFHRKHHKGWGGNGGGGGVPYGGLGSAGTDTAYGRKGTAGTAATETDIGLGGGYGESGGAGNGGSAGVAGDAATYGGSGKWGGIGEAAIGGAAGAYISGGRYARIENGVVGNNFVGSYVY